MNEEKTNFKKGNIVAVKDRYKVCSSVPSIFTIYKIVEKDTYQQIYYKSKQTNKEGSISNNDYLRLATEHDFTNTKIKVYNPTNSTKVQQMLFQFGFCWSGNIQEVKNVSSKILYIHDKVLSFGDSDAVFVQNSNKEIRCSDLFTTTLADLFGDVSDTIEFKTDKEKFATIEVEKMEIKDMKKANLTEAKKQVTEERNNLEVQKAKEIYATLIDNIDYQDRAIKIATQLKNEYLEQLKTFQSK